MPYCTAAQVKAIVNTDVPDADVTEMIAETDAAIDIAVPAATNAIFKRRLSRTWTAYRVMLKDPSSQSIAGYSDERAKTLEQLKAEIDGDLALVGVTVTPAVPSGITFTVGLQPIEP